MIRNFLNLLEKTEKKNKGIAFVNGNADPACPAQPINSTPINIGSSLMENTDKPFLVTFIYNRPEFQSEEKRFDSIDMAKKAILDWIKENNYLNAVDEKKAKRALIQNLENDQELVGSWSTESGWSSSKEEKMNESLVDEAPEDKGPWWDPSLVVNSEIEEESLNESAATHLEVAFSTPEESGYDSRLVKEFKNISKEDALKQAKKEIDIKSVYTKGDSMFAKVAWAGSWDGYDPMVRIGETEDVLNTIGVDSSDDAEWELTNNWDKYEDIFFFDVEEDVEDYEESLEEKIVEINGKYQVQSEKGRNMGTYDTKEEAEKRLKQIEMFKHMKESWSDSDAWEDDDSDSVYKNSLEIDLSKDISKEIIDKFNMSKIIGQYKHEPQVADDVPGAVGYEFYWYYKEHGEYEIIDYSEEIKWLKNQPEVEWFIFENSEDKVEWDRADDTQPGLGESLKEAMSFEDWVEEQGMDIDYIEENPDLEKYYRREYKDSLTKKVAVDDDFYDCFISFQTKPSYNEFIKYMSRKYTKDQLNNKDFMADEYKNFLDYQGFKEPLTEAKADQEKFIAKFGQKAFDDFIKYKQRIKNKGLSTDILWHVKNTPLEDMEKLLTELDNTLSKTKQAKEDIINGADLIYSDDNWKVYHVHTYDAAKRLGSGTTWCITGRYSGAESRGKHYFDSYIRDYNLDDYYFLFDLNNKDPHTNDYLKYCAGVRKNSNKLAFLYNGMQDQEISNDGIPGIPRENQIQPIPGITLPYNSKVIVNGCTIKNDKIVNGHNAYGDLVLPNYIEEIPDGAFSNSEITSIVIPNSVKTFGKGICTNCLKLKDFKFPATLTKIPESMFASCEGLEEVKIPEGITEIGKKAFIGCVGITKLILPSSLRVIDEGAFMYCQGLKDLVIPEGVTTIKAKAFMGCMFDNLVLPHSLMEFGKSGQIVDKMGAMKYNGTRDEWYTIRTDYKYIVDFIGNETNENESLHEDLYGYDEDQFFTRDDLSEYVEEPIEEEFRDIESFILQRAYIEPGNILEVDWEYKDYEDTSKVKIDMRSIRKPVDLCKYGMKIMHIILDKIKEIDPELGESLTEANNDTTISMSDLDRIDFLKHELDYFAYCEAIKPLSDDDKALQDKYMKELFKLGKKYNLKFTWNLPSSWYKNESLGKPLNEVTKLELIKSHKARYAKLENIIKTMKDGVDKDIALKLGLRWIKGKNWEGGLGNSKAVNQLYYDIADKYGLSVDEVYDKFMGDFISNDKYALGESLNESDFEEESRFERIKGKSVMDTDGFYTDYTMYYDTLLDKYVFVFGDEELYSPESGNFDWECDSEQEANEWFNDYNGYDEYEEEHAWLDDMVDQEGKKEPISEDFDSELGKNYINKTVFIKLKNGTTYVRRVLDQGHRAGGHEILIVEDPDFTSKAIKVDDILVIRNARDGDRERGPIEDNDWSDWFNSLID